MTEPTEPAWLTVTEAGRYTRFHRTTIGAALRNGSLRGYRTGQGHWRVHKNDLDAWVRGEQLPAEPAPKRRLA